MKVVIFLISLLLVSGLADAKVYLLVDNNTGEIKSLSKDDDAQVGNNQKKVVLDIDIGEIELLAHPRYYKYKNKKFIMNVKKMSDEEIASTSKVEKQAELDMIMSRAKRNAKIELESEGIVFEYDHGTE